MLFRLASFIRAGLLLALLAAAGCATTRSDPPPVVAPQPPDVTAREAVLEGEKSAQVEAAGEASPAPPPGPAVGPATAAPAAPAPQSAPAPATLAAAPSAQAGARGERFRPTTRSTREIRDQNANAPRALDFEQRLDRTHDRIYTWGQGVVESTDSAFAPDDKPLKPVPAAPFRLGTELLLVDRTTGLKPYVNVDFDIALRLPNLEERLRIFVSSDELDSDARDARGESWLRAGLSYELLRDLDFDIGIRVDLPPVVFASIKWQREFVLGSWDFYPLAKLFAETKESVGYAMGATFDHWSGRQLLRSSSFAKWRHDTDRTEWSQTFIFARANEILAPDRYGSYISADDIGRGYGIRLRSSGQSSKRTDSHEAALFYRNRTPLKWMYWHVEPLVRWDRGWNWSADPGIRLGVDALFWDLARPAR